jgi:O-Antigen ligase
VNANAYWNCRLTRPEWLLLAAVFGLSVAMHLTPVLDGGLGKPVLVLLAALSFLSPVSGFFFIGACSVLPFPEALANEIVRTQGSSSGEGLGTAPAKIGVYMWFIVTFLRYGGLRLKGLAGFWPVLPWLGWFWLLSGEPIYLPNGEYAKALVYAVIACQLANEAKGEYLKCLLGLCLGALVIMVAFWGQRVGLPIELSDWGGERGGVTRLGSVRMDAVMVWPALLIGVGGLAGLGLLASSNRNRLRPPGWLLPLVVVLSVAAVPPLVGTLTQSGYVGAALLSLAVLLASSSMAVQGGFKQAAMGRGVFAALLMAGLLGGLWVTNAFELRTRAAAMSSYREETTESMGIATTRTGVWTDSLAIMAKYPLFGLAGRRQSIVTDETGGQLAHNVFFDFGRSCGIPCMVLLAGFFFWPVIRVWVARQWIDFLPFLLVHFSLLIFWSCLSFIFYKTFWAFWMLMTIATQGPAIAKKQVDGRLERERMRRSRSRSTKAGELRPEGAAK